MLFYGFIYEINEITADEHSKMNESEEIERKKTFIFYGKSNRSILRTQTKNEYTFLLCYTVYKHYTSYIHTEPRAAYYFWDNYFSNGIKTIE